MPHRTLNLEEAARYLHLKPVEIEQLVRDQEIPFERHRERCIFRKVALDAWASRRILGLEPRRLTEYHAQTSAGVRQLGVQEALIPELMWPRFIEPSLPAKTRASVLREMVQLAVKTGRVWDAPRLLASLEAREALSPTGMPGGLALLHTRQPEDYLFESQFIVLGRTVQEVPFGAPDGRATDLFFLLACPDEGLHLHTLARLCLLATATELLARLRAAADAREMYDCLVAAEQEVLAQRR